MLLMLTGCEADTSWAPLPEEGEEPVEVRLHATTVGAGVEVTRASGDTIPLPENMWKIGMLGGTYQNLSLTYDYNSKALKRTDQGTIYYPLQTDTMYIYAYAPFNEKAYIYEEDSVLVKSDWETSQEFDDYIIDPIWAEAAVTKNNPTDTLTFKHAMSGLQIYLVHDQGKEYTNIRIEIDFDRSQYGKMSLETGVITSAHPHDDTYKRFVDNQTLQPKKNTDRQQLDATILPGTVLKKVRVYFEGFSVDGFEQEFTETNPFPAFVDGKINRIVINFGKIEEKASQVNGSLENFIFENEDEIYI
jgi:hypothetical protein